MINKLFHKQSRNMFNYCLLITGCISPPSDMKDLVIQNTKERYRQYIDALFFYITKTNVKNIVYCDNSNYRENEEISRVARQYNKNFEWLSFLGDIKSAVEFGKGYGEGEIIEYAILNSEIIKTCSVLVKVTGRLKVINIDNIIQFSKGKNYFYYITNRYNKKFIDTRFFIINKNDYIYNFMKKYKSVCDCKNIFWEHIFAKTIIEKEIDYRHFILEPNILGFSGTNGKEYRSTRLKIYAKTFLNIFGISIDKLKHT